jgi:hypothetical protein
MAHGALVAEERGFEIFMLVHDQALALRTPGKTVEGYCEALCSLPDWAEGLPVMAEGGVVPFYMKT